MKKELCIVLALITLVGCGPDTNRVPDDALVVTNGTVIDGTGRPPVVGKEIPVEGLIVNPMRRAMSAGYIETGMATDLDERLDEVCAITWCLGRKP